MTRRIAFALVLILSLAPAAHAGIVTWRYSGFVESSMLDEVPVGTPVAFDVHIDTNAVDSCDLEGAAFYEMPGSLMRLGSDTYASEWTSLEVNNPDGNCVYMPGQSTIRLVYFEPSAPVNAASIGLSSVHPVDTVPNGPSVGSSTYFFIGFGLHGSLASGQLSVVEVPEATALTLSALALVTALRRRSPH